MRNLRQTVIMLVVLILCPLMVLGAETAGQNTEGVMPITLKLFGETTWHKDGGAEAIVNLEMSNTDQASRTGELRLILFAINGRIDFNAVSIKALERPFPIKADQAKAYTSFWVEENVTLEKGTQQWRFKITLPVGSRQPNMGLQLLALYRGKQPSGENWISRAALMLHFLATE
ncbi:MAG: hypothetical protein VSS75_011880 [Candidatus Parabeggiatoa sp.]|nr:hypothetical protein [Candidatus Parabeggiatoa sp.]